MNKLFTVKGREIQTQEINLTPFVGNGTKVKVPSEIKLPLIGGGGGGGFLLGGGCKTESFKLESRNPCIKYAL